jgi:hypothetical protein
VYLQQGYFKKLLELIMKDRTIKLVQCVWGYLWEEVVVSGGDEVRNMVDRTMKPLAISSKGRGRDWGRRWWGRDLTNVQCKSILNCHNESPL